MRARKPKELTLSEALERVDPELATYLSIFYAEMAKAQTEGDEETVAYTRSAIAEAMRGVPQGPIDMPLQSAIRRRDRRKRR